jgi:hypothetical protein
MEIPTKITVDLPKPNVYPAGYSDSEDDYDDYMPQHNEPTVKIMSPPETLTAADVGAEEKRRYMRDTSGFESNPLEYSQTQIINSASTSGTQVRHLHNRVRLLEEELQTVQRRQMLLIGIVSGYSLMGVIKWLCR